MKGSKKMNKDFPRIITLLREEKGLSQKRVADDLGISQPLLSHYEKGIRECGLDFVVKAADYYDVSCDYLLGRTLNRSNGKIVIPDIPENDTSSYFIPNSKNLMLTSLNKKLIFNSLNIIFDLLEKINNKGLINECSSYLTAGIYRIFRILYSSNPRNSQKMFSVAEHIYKGKTQAFQIICESNAENLADGMPIAEYRGVERTKLPELSPDIIEEQYTTLSSSLFNLIQNTESRINDYN